MKLKDGTIRKVSVMPRSDGWAVLWDAEDVDTVKIVGVYGCHDSPEYRFNPVLGKPTVLAEIKLKKK